MKSLFYFSLIFFAYFQKSFSFDLENLVNNIYIQKQNKIFYEFPELLVLEQEYLANYPKTKFIFELSTSDFILCKENPKYKISSNLNQIEFKLIFRNQEFLEIGNYNNAIIEYFINTSDIQNTINAMEEGYQKNPLFFAFLYNLGRLYFLNKNYSKSVFYFKKILYYFPNYSRIHYWLGKNFFFLNDEIQGEFHFRKAISLNPDQIEYYIDFIQALKEKKQYSKANLYYQFALKKENFKNHNFFLFFQLKETILEKKYSEALKILEQIQIEKLSEKEKLELKLTKAHLFENLKNYENAHKELSEILNSDQKEFFAKYPKKELNIQKIRLEKLMQFQR